MPGVELVGPDGPSWPTRSGTDSTEGVFSGMEGRGSEWRVEGESEEGYRLD